MLYTKEFYEIMDFFEKNISKTIQKGSQGLRREDKELWKSKYYYCDGNVNESFKIFLNGYMLGKCYTDISDISQIQTIA